MKITIESTSKMILLKESIDSDGIQARVWQGLTESGKPVLCYVTRIALAIENPTTEQTEEFERELKSQRAPVAAAEAIPMRLIL
jgi:hypothetical protein